MDISGEYEPRHVPRYFFRSAVGIDYEHAVRANVEKQNYSVFPRVWYIDADFKCEKCQGLFRWTAEDQKVWFEELGFWVDSCPRLCRRCRAEDRRLLRLRQEYDASVTKARGRGTAEEKRRIVEIVGELLEAFGTLPGKMMETRDLFERQLLKMADAER